MASAKVRRGMGAPSNISSAVLGKCDASQLVVFVIIKDVAVARLLHDLLLVGQGGLRVGPPGGGLDPPWAHAKQSAVDAGIRINEIWHLGYLLQCVVFLGIPTYVTHCVWNGMVIS